jgi:hypothetical protein
MVKLVLLPKSDVKQEKVINSALEAENDALKVTAYSVCTLPANPDK